MEKSLLNNSQFCRMIIICVRSFSDIKYFRFLYYILSLFSTNRDEKETLYELDLFKIALTNYNNIIKHKTKHKIYVVVNSILHQYQPSIGRNGCLKWSINSKYLISLITDEFLLLLYNVCSTLSFLLFISYTYALIVRFHRIPTKINKNV